jgi:hypothetical protein
VPVDYFYHFNPSSGAGPGLPSWNPYAGSGYPVVFDGHNGHASPTRWITRHWPGDTGRDMVIFLRVVFWTLGVSLCLVLLDVPLALVAAGATAAALAPHLSLRIDHVMLDVDLLAPWFPFIVLALVRGAIPWRAAAVFSIALGALVGSLSFLQAQFVFLFACGLVAVAAFAETRGRSLALAGLVGVGFVALYFNWLPLVKHIGDFVSSRSGGACIAGLDHTGIEGMGRELLGLGYLKYSTGSLIGMMVILFAAGRLRVRFFVYALAMILAFVVLGFPSPAGNLRSLLRAPSGLASSVLLLDRCRVGNSFRGHADRRRAGDRPNMGLADHRDARGLDFSTPPLLEARLSRCRDPRD